MKRNLPRIFVVATVDVATGSDFPDRTSEVLSAGGQGCAVQLRAHGLPGGRVFDLAGDLRERTRRSGAGLWINDRVDVALVIGADGVQLGARSLDPDAARRVLGRSCWIGRSIHTPEEVGSAEADVYLLGNIFETPSHPERAALGLAAVREAASAGRPIVAIGGMTAERTREVIEAGAWGIAVSSGVWGARDPAAAIARYARALAEAEHVGQRIEPN